MPVSSVHCEQHIFHCIPPFLLCLYFHSFTFLLLYTLSDNRYRKLHACDTQWPLYYCHMQQTRVESERAMLQ